MYIIIVTQMPVFVNSLALNGGEFADGCPFIKNTCV
jgi:hypothetical protein